MATRSEAATKPRSRSSSFSDTPLQPGAGSGQNGPTVTDPATAGRLDSMEGQIRRLAASLQILGRQLETFLGDQSEHLGRRAPNPFETPETRARGDAAQPETVIEFLLQLRRFVLHLQLKQFMLPPRCLLHQMFHLVSLKVSDLC